MPKVSAVVSYTDHARLSKIARDYGSTIGIVVFTAIRWFLKDPQDKGARLKRDGRRKKRVE